MTAITRIDAHIYTGLASGSGTDASIYLGIGGREFLLDTDANNFETGAEETFTFGQDTNVQDPEYNDPRNPQIELDHLDDYPVYVRLAPNTSADWGLDRAIVTVNPQDEAHTYDNLSLTGEDTVIWLGARYGEKVYLTRTR